VSLIVKWMLCEKYREGVLATGMLSRVRNCQTSGPLSRLYLAVRHAEQSVRCAMVWKEEVRSSVDGECPGVNMSTR
jgi:hypothetical protein